MIFILLLIVYSPSCVLSLCPINPYKPRRPTFGQNFFNPESLSIILLKNMLEGIKGMYEFCYCYYFPFLALLVAKNV